MWNPSDASQSADLPTLQAERDLAIAARDAAELARDRAESARHLAEQRNEAVQDALTALEERVAFLLEADRGNRSYREHVTRIMREECLAELLAVSEEVTRLRLLMVRSPALDTASSKVRNDTQEAI